MPNCCTLHILPFQLSLSRFIFILLPTTRINHGSSLPLTEPWKKKKPSESLSFFLLYYSGEPHRKSKFEPIWDKTPFGKRSNFFKKQILLGRSPLHKDYNDTSHHTYNYMKNRVKYKLCDQGLFSSVAGSDYFGECLPLQALSFYLHSHAHFLATNIVNLAPPIAPSFLKYTKSSPGARYCHLIPLVHLPHFDGCTRRRWLSRRTTYFYGNLYFSWELYFSWKYLQHCLLDIRGGTK